MTIYLVCAYGGEFDWNVKAFQSYVDARAFKDACIAWHTKNFNDAGGPDPSLHKLGGGYGVSYEVEEMEVTPASPPRSSPSPQDDPLQDPSLRT